MPKAQAQVVEQPIVSTSTIVEVPTVDSIIASTTQKYDRYSPAFIKEVIKCEGDLYQNDGWDGHQNYDKHRSKDWGPLQVNDYWHKKEMERLDMDIHNWQDSLVFGIMMMNEQGTTAWNASKSCWNKKTP